MTRELLLQRLKEYDIPAHMHEGMLAYILEGRPPGGFLYAVLTNDLYEATRKADMMNRNCLAHYVDFIVDHAPMECWGSSEKIEQWRAHCGLLHEATKDDARR